jgi:hypothetical protein
VYIRSQPAFLSASSCKSSDWSAVETRAYPILILSLPFHLNYYLHIIKNERFSKLDFETVLEMKKPTKSTLFIGF